MKTAELQVTAIAWTHFDHPMANAVSGGWHTDAEGGEALAEFAGRACYQSWTKPNPATANNAGYLQHILQVGHLSVLEHGTVTMYLTGVSRSLTHELVRHRHFSYSQLSQRYVPGGDAPVIEPDVIAADPYLHGVFIDAVDAAQRAYAELLHALERKFTEQPTLWAACDDGACDLPHLDGDDVDPNRRHQLPDDHPGVKRQRAAAKTASRKAARQAARAVLPNATETRIVVTGNYRAWRHFLTMRATEAADVEIRALAIACLAELNRVAPNVFADFELKQLGDSTWTASTSYGG